MVPDNPGPAPATQTRDPALVDHIKRLHRRQLEMCRRLKALSGIRARNELALEAEMLLAFLFVEIPAHVREEQEILLPLLRRRCGDDIHTKKIFLRLEREHELNMDITGLLIKYLKRLTGSLPRGNLVRFDTLARSFSDTYSEHVEWENENLLPLLRDP